MAAEQSQLEVALGAVEEPEFARTLGDLGLLRTMRARRRRVQVEVALPVAAWPGLEELADRVHRAARSVAGVEEVDLEFVVMTEDERMALRSRLRADMLGSGDGDGDGDGWDVSCGSRQAPAYQAPASQPHQVATAGYSGGSYPGGSFGQCVVARESGGNAQVMNATGHYGLYQFAASTWAAYGGNPADFGHASVAEQNQVFANALAAGGQSNWSPYDGC